MEEYFSEKSPTFAPRLAFYVLATGIFIKHIAHMAP
jgi:hypothetical protein